MVHGVQMWWWMVLNDTEVVCRELGFGQAIANRSEGYYRQDSTQFWFIDLSCTGTESSIVIFLHNEWEVDDCNHNSNASISCAVPKGFIRVRILIILLYAWI